MLHIYFFCNFQGAKKQDENLFFLVKLSPAGHKLMAAAQANIDMPHLVIGFYLERLVYSPVALANNLTGLIEQLDARDVVEVVGMYSELINTIFLM